MPHARYTLEGRIVPMTADGVLLARGVICVEGETIVAVQDAAAPLPAAFADAPRIRTGGTIFPGFIELHNHLCYNAMPLWDVPQLYTNNGQWKNHPDYARRITKPAQVLAGTPGLTEALVRYVECRSLLGGVTTSQGLTLSSEAGIPSFFQGLVRNVEKTGRPDLPAAGTGIANVSKAQAQAYLQKLGGHSCYLQHLSEGSDETARGWFHNLKLDGDAWAITEALCGIHSAALGADEFAVLQRFGGSMVWSPLSNYLLYGRTADIAAAGAAGLPIALGCDWAPSGSKNLLGELKVAWLANEQAGAVFTARELVEMVTVNPARILRWQAKLGTIEAGKLADLIVFDGMQGDPYEQVIRAGERALTLAIIGGVPRLGQPSLMRRFGLSAGEVDAIKVGEARRWLYLEQEDAHPLVRGLSLTEATQRLRTAMARLPELAQELDAGGGIALAGAGAAGGAPPGPRVILDFEQEPADLALAALPLADFVTEPMALDGPTVADDPAFLNRLVASRTLPEFLKRGLPPLYGRTIPLPDAATFLEPLRDEFAPGLVESVADLRDALRSWGELTPAERLALVEQSLLLLDQSYVHLPFKRAMHAVDPLQRLRLLRYRMSEFGPELEFHAELAQIFAALRDLHTTYRLPAPFRTKVAFLPFMVEEYWEGGGGTEGSTGREPRYQISKLIGAPGPKTLVPGVRLLSWNGVPIARAVTLLAAQQAGGNAAARHAQALNSLTLRPLAAGAPPAEEWVTIRYEDSAGRVRTWTQDWLTLEPGRSDKSADPSGGDGSAAAAALGLDPQGDEIQESKRALYARKVARAEHFVAQQIARGEADSYSAIKNSAGESGLDTTLPTIFRADLVDTPSGRFGHLRIFTFNVGDDEVFVEELIRLLRLLPQEGLILDIRGNPGGHIYAAERALQTLTPHRIEPQTTQMLCTPLMLAICRAHAPSPTLLGLDLSPWIASIEQSVETGSLHSLAFPITPPALCNDRGQHYFGPALLITDALCYSAADIFAAGFQDHAIGPILGTSGNTGAGGANVWSYALLRRLLPPAFAPLPRGADLRVAVRRTLRSGKNAGGILEDLGVRPDQRHWMTRADLLHDNRDLMAAAGKLLAGRPAYPLRLEGERRTRTRFSATLTFANLTRLDLYLDDRPIRTLDVTGTSAPLDLARAPGATLHVRGFVGDAGGDRLVAALRRTIG